MIETRNTTVTLTANTEKTVEFSAAYNYFYLKNDSSAPLYVAMSSNITAGADGVFSCAAGESIGTMHGYPANKLYLLGEGTVQVCGVGSADNPFKVGVRGGDGEKKAEKASTYTFTDSVDYPILALNLYGKSIQNGTPTPEVPVDIVSLGDSGFDIIVKGNSDFSLICFRGQAGNIITQQPVAMAGKVDDLLTAEVKTTGDGLTYQWQWSTDNGATWKNSSAKTAIYRVQVQKAYNGYMYRCVVTDANNTSEISDVIKMYVTEDTYNITKSVIALPALCGIPVTSGENYTDSSGHKWVCDEFVYTADGFGKIVKRTAKISSYSEEVITGEYISSTGSLTSGAAVIYRLAEPQEIALTASEISALRILQTFNGTTNIFNNANAEMTITYCKNKMLSECVKPITKNLQSQIDELKAAILSLGGNV